MFYLDRFGSVKLLPTSRKKREIWGTLYCFACRAGYFAGHFHSRISF
jgi:hypothetical protein